MLLGLALCIPTEMATTPPVIAADVRSFIHIARSIDFDCVQLRTYGQETLAAMFEELSGLGIVLDAAQSSKHTSQIDYC